MMDISIEERKINLTTNMTYLASNFKSYGLLSRLLKCQPKFISRAISTPKDLSLRNTKCASVSLGIPEAVLLGDQEVFKRGVQKWLLAHQKLLKNKGKKNGRRHTTKRMANI